LVHILVGEAFLSPRPEGLCVNHIDCDKTNNRPENLEYITRRENSFHAKTHGRMPRGENHPNAKLAESQVREIRRQYAAGEASQYKLAAAFGVSQVTIGNIVRRDQWRYCV
jgi:hypothetical protein